MTGKGKGGGFGGERGKKVGEKGKPTPARQKKVLDTLGRTGT